MEQQPQPLPPLLKRLAQIFILVAIVGLIDATYLSVQKFSGATIPCFVGGSCDIVTSSRFSEFFGIPISLFGALYYLTVVIFVSRFLDKGLKKLMIAAIVLASVGFLVSLLLLYVQAFVLHAYCLYCLLSAGTSTLLFIL